MQVAILGFAGQGKAAYEYWDSADNQLTICDRSEETEIPDDVPARLGVDYLKNLDEFDLLVRTPSLHPRDILDANPDTPNILDKVTTVTDEFMRVCPSKNIIGVTGTKGKGTTSTLISKFLEASGKTVHLGGNIGVPPLEMLKGNIKPDDWVVLELANFQLIDIKRSPHIAVVLMVVSEHLNWHDDLQEYITAKQNLFRFQTKDDLAIYNRNNAYSADVAGVSPGTKLTYEVPGPGAEPTKREGAYELDNKIYMNEVPVCDVADVALLGRHNLENICAAICASWEIINHDTEVIKKVVSNFNGLEHRLEFVREFNKVKYYDDSFGTTPETAIVAIQAFDQPKVVILGGSDKGSTYEAMAHVVASNNVRAAVLVGDTADKIEKALLAAGFDDIIDGGTTMETMVRTAQAQASPGDIVLLSTGCASFGLFGDYKDRGNQFKSVVKALA